MSFSPALLLSLLLPTLSAAALSSPDGRLRVELTVDSNGTPHYQVSRAEAVVIESSELGLVCGDGNFARHLTFAHSSSIEPVSDHYELLTGKRRQNTYRAQRQTHAFVDAQGRRIEIVFQVSNDGVAFRYVFPDPSSQPRAILEERSSFHLPRDAKAWLQPMSVAKSGWKRTNPSYEEHYQCEIAVGTPSTLGAGWVFPALFRAGETWIAITETAVDSGDCGSRLRHESPDGEYRIGLPDPRETREGRPAHPVITRPWQSPWRVIVIGDLATVAESTLGTDLAIPARTPLTPALRPGKSSWSWPLLGDGQTIFAVQRDFIDYAAQMDWAYCLIDAMWDRQIGYEKMRELADYACTKNVGLLLWYNTNGTWNDAPQTPRDRVHTPAARRAEFARLRAMGIKGVKIDFFGGDGAPVIELYHEILRDAAEFGLLVNFHGATLPRGWTRTYPNLMTMEAIKGFEFITFTQENADAEPSHCAMLPFTRNLFEAMDFTPVCLDRLPGQGVRRTTVPFELALAVLFTSGIQHYPEIPAGMAKQPEFVRAFMRSVPSVWDDTKFLDGYPAKFAVLARQGDGRWYVAGINGEAHARKLTLDLSRLAPAGAHATLLADGTHASECARREISWAAGESVSLTLAPNGGFVLVLDSPAAW